MQRNDDLIRHFREQQQDLKLPDYVQGSERKGGHDKDSDMSAAAPPSRDKLRAEMARGAQHAPGDIHSGVDGQGEASSAMPAAAAHAEAGAGAKRAGAQPDGAGGASAGQPNVPTDRHKMKLTFILVGTNAHRMGTLQLKQFRTQVLLHSQSRLHPGIAGLPKCITRQALRACTPSVCERAMA